MFRFAFGVGVSDAIQAHDHIWRNCKFAVLEESSCARSDSRFNRSVRRLLAARRDFFKNRGRSIRRPHRKPGRASSSADRVFPFWHAGLRSAQRCALRTSLQAGRRMKARIAHPRYRPWMQGKTTPSLRRWRSFTFLPSLCTLLGGTCPISGSFVSFWVMVTELQICSPKGAGMYDGQREPTGPCGHRHPCSRSALGHCVAGHVLKVSADLGCPGPLIRRDLGLLVASPCLGLLLEGLKVGALDVRDGALGVGRGNQHIFPFSAMRSGQLNPQLFAFICSRKNLGRKTQVPSGPALRLNHAIRCVQ